MPAVLPDVAAAIVRLSRAAGILRPPVTFRPVPGLPLIAFDIHGANGFEEQREWYVVPVADAVAVVDLAEAGTLDPYEIAPFLYDKHAQGVTAEQAAAALGIVVFHFDDTTTETHAAHPCAADLNAACDAGHLRGWAAYGYALGVTVPAEHPDAAREILAPLGYVLRAERPAEWCPAGTTRQSWIFGY